MASDVIGMTSYTSKERELVKMQAEVNLQEEVTRLAQKRLAMTVLEAEIHSASNRSVRSCENMRSHEILSPPLRCIKLLMGVEDHQTTVLTATMKILKKIRAHLPSTNQVRPLHPQHR